MSAADDGRRNFLSLSPENGRTIQTAGDTRTGDIEELKKKKKGKNKTTFVSVRTPVQKQLLYWTSLPRPCCMKHCFDAQKLVKSLSVPSV